MPGWTNSGVLTKILGGLIVSCQAEHGSPLDSPEVLAAMAAAAEEGGATAIRANLPRNIASIRERVTIPIIGIYKKVHVGYDVYITPTFEEARAVAEAGQTSSPSMPRHGPVPKGRPGNRPIDRIHRELRLPVMADIATLQEAERAAELGADLIATTLCGYTAETIDWDVPNRQLIEGIARRVAIPLLVEGRVHTPQMARQVREWGAQAVSCRRDRHHGHHVGDAAIPGGSEVCAPDALVEWPVVLQLGLAGTLRHETEGKTDSSGRSSRLDSQCVRIPCPGRTEGGRFLLARTRTGCLHVGDGTGRRVRRG